MFGVLTVLYFFTSKSTALESYQQLTFLKRQR